MNSRTSTALIALSLIAGAAGAQSTQAVEWKVSDGGNGHWYQLFSSPTNWEGARQQCVALGGHLPAIADVTENNFLRALVLGKGWAWIGAYQDGGCEPGCNWGWITGEGWSGWSLSRCIFSEGSSSGWTSGQDALLLDEGGFWNDYWNWEPVQFLCEWEADCNGDGIVDYGQILRGELIDLNSNGVPDVCETSISSVSPPSIPAQGGSVVTIRGNFPANPAVLIGGVPATNVVRESLTKITATSPDLLPGMASVKVNDFTLEEALYIRPQCGSDLDQDGEVTAADIAIVLLDFGPCYFNAANTQPDDSTPFLLKEESAAVAPQSR